MNRYLAIDIRASSGRHIVGWREDGELRTKEVYRFPNGAREEGGHLVWDVEALLREVKNGIGAASGVCLPGQPDRGRDCTGSREAAFLRAVPPDRLPVSALQYDLPALCR